MSTTRTGVRRGIAVTVGAALLASLGLAGAQSAAAAEPSTVVATTQSPGYTEVGTWTTARDPSYGGIQPRYSRTEGDTASWQLEAPADSRYQLGTYYTESVDNGTQVSYSWTTSGVTAADRCSSTRPATAGRGTCSATSISTKARWSR
ncbi:hypothetical protein [Homoserinibacter gongjuensis]|uniref:Uncharacterized protein n=1 Tax=Homoserinibacter gongjuensis TaxID=1162968 RepID=A0ABQ6JV76_9MICO|nr:hypothetical protein [Homoserinibacter gongjuensis]GMA91904.1 hypothetical protein GCM10025869_24330 [Homoserinibacter gongjuensis]